MTQTNSPIIFGLLAEFDGPGALLAAARRTRDAGYKKFDAHSPYPVHGMDLAMGLGRSKLGWVVAAGALAGAITAVGLQWYTNTLDYPLITQGKPYFSWQAFLIVTFELTVLFAAFSAVIGMFMLNALPAWYHPALTADAFTGVSDNRFFLVIQSTDPNYKTESTEKFLTDLGAKSIVVLHD